MRGIVAALALSGLAVSATAGDAPPPSAPPALTGPVSEPPAELPRGIEAAPMPAADRVLVVPGVTTPRPGARPRKPGSAAAPTVTGLSDTLPPLLGPAEMPASPAGRVPPRNQRATTNRPPDGHTRPPLTLESEPAPPRGEVFDDLPEPDAHKARPGRIDPRPTLIAPPRRPTGLFGRFFPPVTF